MHMIAWEQHVHPHGPLASIAPGLWQVTGTMKRNPLPRNMHIWRGLDGGLLVHSPVCLDGAGMEALEALGPVKWIVAPCRFHRLDAAPYRQRYPDAQLLAPACARKQVAKIARVDGSCEDALASVGVVLHRPGGLKPYELHLELPLEDGSRALLMTDALFNLGVNPPSGFGGLTLKWMGSVGPLGITLTGRAFLLRDKAKYRAYLAGLADRTDLSVLAMAHGEAVVGNVGTALREAAGRV